MGPTCPRSRSRRAAQPGRREPTALPRGPDALRQPRPPERQRRRSVRIRARSKPSPEGADGSAAPGGAGGCFTCRSPGLFRPLAQSLLWGRLAVLPSGRRAGFGRVLGDFDRPTLPDHRHLDLARVLELVFDLAGDLVREQDRLVVVDLLRLHDPPDLATGLERVDLLDAAVVAGQLLEGLEALDVVLEALAASAGTRGRDRVGRDQQHRFDGLWLHLVVMRLDRVHDSVALAVAPRELGRDRGVRALDLVGQRLAEIVQERGPPRRLHARVELRGHDPGEVDDLERVLEDVLAVARPEAQPAENLDELLVDGAAVRLEDGLLAGMDDVLLDLRLRLVVHLLDPGGMDAAVLDQLRQGHLGDLPADAVERREHDRLRGVVDDEVDSRQVLEGPDVAAFAADDPPFHVVGRELDERNGGLGSVVRRDALESVRDEVAGAPLRLGLRLFLHLTNAACKLVPDQLLRAAEEVCLRLVRCHARDPFELFELGVLRLLQDILKLLRVRFAIGDSLLAPGQLRQLAVDLVFLREHPLLDLDDLGATL